ncbi:MAG: hypothetical protein ABIH34_03755 [Nanoarchaeota archaeon]
MEACGTLPKASGPSSILGYRLASYEKARTRKKQDLQSRERPDVIKKAAITWFLEPFPPLRALFDFFAHHPKHL